ncbi:hypothetical protein [Nocardia sp. GTS18]|uniref:hypothetical protein n=1 Tax=Nocardia sp. GTS18 TaxID=1778064 RepID=UPI0015EEF325|nr:hypothetical protein [Nocardia sp. GTS18]
MSDIFRAERRNLLDAGNRIVELYKSAPDTEEGDAIIYDAFEYFERYVELLPEVLVSRCPFSGAAFRWPMDNVDLDGWYWEYDKPHRRRSSIVPRTWLAMGGAVRLTEPVAPAPFSRRPGPDVPYVIPAILNHPTVRAVITQITIGPHTGWATTYYSTVRELGVPLENTWGADNYDTYDVDGVWRGWDEHTFAFGDHDFDLRPWFDTGKLLWIAPDDPTATLREGATDCPYIDLDGTRLRQRIDGGTVSRN